MAEKTQTDEQILKRAFDKNYTGQTVPQDEELIAKGAKKIEQTILAEKKNPPQKK